MVPKFFTSSYGFICGHLSTDFALAILTLKLNGWSRTIYIGLSYAVFKCVPTLLCKKSLLTTHQLQDYRLLHHFYQTYHPLFNEDASDHIIE